MNLRYFFSALVGAAVVLIIAKSIPLTSAPAPAAPQPGPVAAAVEETLHQHEGEHSVMVEAFEAALHPKAAS